MVQLVQRMVCVVVVVVIIKECVGCIVRNKHFFILIWKVQIWICEVCQSDNVQGWGWRSIISWWSVICPTTTGHIICEGYLAVTSEFVFHFVWLRHQRRLSFGPYCQSVRLQELSCFKTFLVIARIESNWRHLFVNKFRRSYFHTVTHRYWISSPGFVQSASKLFTRVTTRGLFYIHFVTICMSLVFAFVCY